jgi:hypothetical protein
VKMGVVDLEVDVPRGASVEVIDARGPPNSPAAATTPEPRR